MHEKHNSISRRRFINQAGGAAAITAVGLAGGVQAFGQDGVASANSFQPLEGMRFTLGDAEPNTSSQYLVIGHLQDDQRNPLPNSSFMLQVKRDVDAFGVETIAEEGGMYAEIENSEGARFIELCYVVYYSILQEVTTDDGTGRTFFTEKSYNTQGMVPLTIDLSQPRPDGNLFVLKYSDDPDLPGGGGATPEP